MQMNLIQKYQNKLELLREKTPLIHHLTNVVTMNDCANITLALGGSPVMAHSLAEAPQMAEWANAIVLNMGTPEPDFIEAMILAAQVAKRKKIPVVFDPVGAGATAFRQQIALRLIKEVKPDIIKGNLAEIRFLAGMVSTQRGVDSLDTSDEAGEAVLEAAKQYSCVVVATGKTDTFSDGKMVLKLEGGSPWLTKITGTGCMTSSLVGCFAAVHDDPLQASIWGVAAMKLAGEIAAKRLKKHDGTATYRGYVIDAISRLTEKSLTLEKRITVC
jgi:hydroxyethylthiazole kinase